MGSGARVPQHLRRSGSATGGNLIPQDPGPFLLLSTPRLSCPMSRLTDQLLPHGLAALRQNDNPKMCAPRLGSTKFPDPEAFGTCRCANSGFHLFLLRSPEIGGRGSRLFQWPCFLKFFRPALLISPRCRISSSLSKSRSRPGSEPFRPWLFLADWRHWFHQIASGPVN